MTLPKPGDPLVLPGGIVVFDDETKESRRVSQNEYMERRVIPDFKQFNPAEQAAKDTLPEADEHKQVVQAAVVGLRMMGLDFLDIAEMLGVREETLLKEISAQSMQVTFERVMRGLINVNADSIHGRVAAYSNNALSVMLELMNDDTTRDDVRFKSAQDILDRSGTGADHFFGAKDRGTDRDDELRIVMMDEEGEKEKVSVTMKRKR